MENSFIILSVTMLVLSILVFIISEYDILNPVCIVTTLMTISVLLATSCANRWHLYMSTEASLIIITSIICFDIGGFWADWRIKKNLNFIVREKENCIFYIKNYKLAILCILILILGYFQYKEFYVASQLLGNQSGPLDFSSMIKAIRPSIENETFKFSRWNSYRLVVAEMGVFCSIFCFFMNSIVELKYYWLGNIKYLMPLIAFIPFILSNTGRELPLDVMLFSLLTGTIIYQIKNEFSIKCKVKTLGFFAICSGAFFMLFLVLGMLSGKVSIGGRPPYEILAHYGGLSMPAFSIFLNNMPIENSYIGATTLSDVYNKLRVMGMDVPQVRGFLPFVEFTGITTNVYTMMARYVKDYGIIGMHLIMALIAMFYVIFYDYVRVISRKYVVVAFYSLLPMTLFFATNDDRFFTTVLNTTTLYNFIILFLMFKVLVNRTEK